MGYHVEVLKANLPKFVRVESVEVREERRRLAAIEAEMERRRICATNCPILLANFVEIKKCIKKRDDDGLIKLQDENSTRYENCETGPIPLEGNKFDCGSTYEAKTDAV